MIGGNPLTGAKLALDDDIVPYFFVRITRIDLLEEGEAPASTVVTKPGPVVGVQGLVVTFHTRVDPNPPTSRAVVPNTSGLVV